jgi:hypothetical protein
MGAWPLAAAKCSGVEPGIVVVPDSVVKWSNAHLRSRRWAHSPSVHHCTSLAAVVHSHPPLSRSTSAPRSHCLLSMRHEGAAHHGEPS